MPRLQPTRKPPQRTKGLMFHPQYSVRKKYLVRERTSPSSTANPASRADARKSVCKAQKAQWLALLAGARTQRRRSGTKMKHSWKSSSSSHSELQQPSGKRFESMKRWGIQAEQNFCGKPMRSGQMGPLPTRGSTFQLRKRQARQMGHSRRNLRRILRRRRRLSCSFWCCLRRRQERKKPLVSSQTSAPQKQAQMASSCVCAQKEVVGAKQAIVPRFASAIPASDSVFNPEKLFTRSLFRSDRDSSSRTTVRTEKISISSVFLCRWRFLRAMSMTEQVRKSRRRRERRARTAMVVASQSCSMRLGVSMRRTSKDRSGRYSSRAARAYWRSSAEQMRLKQRPLMKVRSDAYWSGVKQEERPCSRQNWLLASAMHSSQRPSLLKPSPDSA